MWVVCDDENGVLIVTDDKNKALKVYKKAKEKWASTESVWNKVCGGDRNTKVVIAKVEKELYVAFNGKLTEKIYKSIDDRK